MDSSTNTVSGIGLAESLGQKSMKETLELVVKEGSHAKVLLVLRELQRTLEAKEVHSGINKGILDYIYAVGALAFACKDINVEDVSALLLALRIEPEHQMLEAIRAMHYKNYNIHMNVLYFLTAVGVEPTIEKVVEILRAMEFSPDATLAGYTIEYFKEFNSGKVSYNIPEPQGDVSVIFNKIADMTFSLSATIADFVIKQIEALVHDERLMKFSESEILPYLAAIGLLTFSGKDCDRGSIEGVMEAMGRPLDGDILNVIGSIHVRNHITYIIALYFIIAVGQEPSLDKIISVVKSMDTVPDALVARNVISFYKISGLDHKGPG